VTASPRRTVDTIAAPYANFLTPVPDLGPGVCGVCRRGVAGTYARCFKCGRAPLGVGAGGADAVAFVSLAPARGQLAYELVNYKRPATSLKTRDRFTVGLAAVLWKWRARHESCLAHAIGVHSFDVVTTVPSSSSGRAGEHPLVRLVTGVVVGSHDRYRPLLVATTAAVAQREFTAARFTAVDRLAGEPVLLIDDTWTTGAHAHGAAAALKAAGAGPVAALTIGRWYHPDDAANERVEQHLRRRRWDWEQCMFEP
jgi:predicted amidophosphoribosyltransferase